MNKRFLILAVLVVSLVLLLSSCSAELFDDSEIRNYTYEMIEAIIADDADTAYSLISDACTKDEFLDFFNKIRPSFEHINDYELELISFDSKTNFEGGKSYTTVEAEYLLKADDFECVVSAITHSDYNKLAGINFNAVENTELYSTGTISNMSGATLAQWLMLLLNIPVTAFTVIAIVSCARSKINKKAFWIVFIIIGNILVGWTVAGNSFNFNFDVGFFNYSSYVIYGNGKTVFDLVLPIGSVFYFASRKSLIKAAEANQPKEQYSPQFSEITSADENEKAPVTDKYCDNCGEKLAENAKFCTRCGKNLGE